MKEIRKWAKDRMEARFTDTFFHMSILHSGVLPPALLKRELDYRITEELRRPPDRPKDDHHKKDDKKHAAAAVHAPHGKGHAAPAPPKPKAKEKPAPKQKATKHKPAPKQAKPAVRKPKPKAAKKKR
jgi:hypothetical protein